MTAPKAEANAANRTGAAKAQATRVVEASFVAGAVEASGLPAPTFSEIAFAGRSNVGKSSLLNTMVERRGPVRTSKTPGCTRQLNVFDVRCSDGLRVHFVDLPGYGWARRSKAERTQWQTMIEGYLVNRASLRAVAVLVDVRRGIEEEEEQLLDFLGGPRPVSESKPLEIVLVATKIDKLGAAARKPALEAVKKQAREFAPVTAVLKGHAARVAARGVAMGPAVGFSAVTGDGREELWARIRAAVL
jgi:GTP-binding protein